MIKKNGLLITIIIIILLIENLTIAFSVNSYNIQQAIQIYNTILYKLNLNNKLLYNNNIQGRIVWNEQYFMNSLLNMYIATGKMEYIDMFEKHAKNILNIRDDHIGVTDIYGRVNAGWSAGGYYTLGVPYIILSDDGTPSMAIQAIHKLGNNALKIEIENENSKTFNLQVIYNFRNQTYQKKYSKLTMENIEYIINSNLSPINNYIRVLTLSNLPPKSGEYDLTKTYTRAFTEHTGLIILPLIRYIYLQNSCDIYSKKDFAKKIKEEIKPSIEAMLSQWVNDGDSEGYFISDPIPTYWAAGLPMPYNYLSASGLSLLYGYMIYDKQDYKEKAIKLAKTIKNGIDILPDGTLTMHYWYGKPFNGWDIYSPEMPTMLYKKLDPINGVEDISHFSLTLWFMYEMNFFGLEDFSRELNAAAKTFSKRLFLGPPKDAAQLAGWSGGAFMAHGLDGSGKAYDYAAGMYALLRKYDQEIYNKVFTIYKTRFANGASVTIHEIDYLSGYVLLGWSILARGGEQEIKCPK